MNSKLNKIIGVCMAMILLASCSTDEKIEKKIHEVLKRKPELVFQAIEQNPEEFMRIVQAAASKSQKQLAEKRQQEEDHKILAAFEKPLKPEITSEDKFRGNKNAPITIVEYSDFECPFCQRGSQTVESLLKKYPGKIKVVFKHLPLSFHPQALISAKYFEAISLQSSDKAFSFHSEIFKNQRSLKNGEIFLKKIAQTLKVDMAKLKKDINSKVVSDKIDRDIMEAKKFGIEGTPGFIVNGVPVKGAYPVEHFVGIIEKLQAKGKLTL